MAWDGKIQVQEQRSLHNMHNVEIWKGKFDRPNVNTLIINIGAPDNTDLVVQVVY